MTIIVLVVGSLVLFLADVVRELDAKHNAFYSEQALDLMFFVFIKVYR